MKEKKTVKEEKKTVKEKKKTVKEKKKTFKKKTLEKKKKIHLRGGFRSCGGVGGLFLIYRAPCKNLDRLKYLRQEPKANGAKALAQS